MERKYNKQPKLHIRKGDIVKVIAGDSKGSQGRVPEVLSATRKVLVEGYELFFSAFTRLVSSVLIMAIPRRIERIFIGFSIGDTA